MTGNRTTAYPELFRDIRLQFLEAVSPGAHLEALELVCFGGGMSREAFYRDGCVPPETEEKIRTLARRHLDGEPVAYIIGEWEFYGLTLDVNESVLIPRVDTEVLAEAAIDYVKDLGPCRVLDLCAGSGCVGLAVAANAQSCQALLGEISGPAVQVCRQNIRRCGLTDRVSVMNLDALQPPPRSIGELHCIVCNPPYIPQTDIETLERSVKDFEPHLALCGGEDGLDFYRAIAHEWKKALTESGRIYFEVGIGQADAVLRLMRREGFGDINVLPDTQGIPRVVYGTVLEEARR